MRIGRVDRMPLAVDDDDGDLALALAERIAGSEMRSEGAHHLRQLRVVHPDLVGAGQTAARLDQRAVGVLLLRAHLVVGNLGIASEGRRLGHLGLLSSGELSVAVSIARAAAAREAPINRAPAAAATVCRGSSVANEVANHSQRHYVTDRYRALRACHVCMPVQWV